MSHGIWAHDHLELVFSANLALDHSDYEIVEQTLLDLCSFP
jgi:hypothetical protein